MAEVRAHNQQGWRETENATAEAAKLQETIVQAEEVEVALDAANQVRNKALARIQEQAISSREGTPDTTRVEPEEQEQVTGAGAAMLIFKLSESSTIAISKASEEGRREFLEEVESQPNVTQCELTDVDMGDLKQWQRWVGQRDGGLAAGPMPKLLEFKIQYSNSRARDLILLASVARMPAGNPMAGIRLGEKQMRVDKGQVGVPGHDITYLQVDVRCYTQSTTANEVAKAVQEATGAAKPEQLDSSQGGVLKREHVALAPLVRTVVVTYPRMDRSTEKDCFRFKALIQVLPEDPKARRIPRVVYTAVGNKRFVLDCKHWVCSGCKAWLQAKRGGDRKVHDWEVSHTEHQVGECARFKEGASADRDVGGRNQAP